MQILALTLSALMMLASAEPPPPTNITGRGDDDNVVLEAEWTGEAAASVVVPA